MTDDEVLECAEKRFVKGEPVIMSGKLYNEFLARLIALARIGAAVQPGPISEAPKDGTKMLLMKIVGHPEHETALWWAVIGFWSDRWKNWNDGVEPSGLADPTHFILKSALPQVKP